jgi:hypothetical protein
MSEFIFPKIDEKMRQALLDQELAMRSKQPTAWTKTKFRPYANFKTRSTI